MPIVLRHNAELEVSLVEYSGAVTAAELRAHAQFNADNPVWLGFDCLSVARADTDIRNLAPSDLDAIFHGFHDLFRPLNLVIMRRSSWVWGAPIAKRLLQHWLGKRNDDPLAWSEVRLFDTYDEAADWLLLTPAARDTLKVGEGFAEIARFDIAPATRTVVR